MWLICYKRGVQSLSGFGFPAGGIAIVFFGLLSEVLNFETRISLLIAKTFYIPINIPYWVREGGFSCVGG
jgi:hypothetical protein